MRRRLATLLPLALLLAGSALAAQEAAGPAPAPPAPRAADVASADAIVAALYDVISGPAGQARDWDRFRSLFIPAARLIMVGKRPDGAIMHRVMTPEDYVQAAGPQLEARGFFEREIGRTVDRFGAVTHVFSAYDSRRAADDAEPFARGVNSIQLLHDGNRWWVVTIFWDSEREGQPIPAELIRQAGGAGAPPR